MDILESLAKDERVVAAMKDTFENQESTAYKLGQKVADFSEVVAKENTAQTEDGVQYSLRAFSDGKRFVDVQARQDEFDGLSVSEMNRKAKQIIKQQFVGKVIGQDNRVFVNGASAHEYVFPSKAIDEKTREAKLRASSELDNLLDAGTNLRNEPDGKDGHVHPNAVGGFDYYDTIFKVGNEYYSGVVNVEVTERGRLLKDVTKIRNITQDIISSYGNNPKSDFLRDASMGSISEPGGNVNGKDSAKSEAAARKTIAAAVADPQVTDKLMGLYRDGDADAADIAAAFEMGYGEFSVDKLRSAVGGKVTESVRKAYESGKQYRTQEDAKRKSGKAPGGKVSMYYLAKDGKLEAFRDGKAGKLTMTGKQSVAVKTADFLHRIGIGGNVYFFESYEQKNAKGETVRVFKDKDGKEKTAPNGIYYSNGDIYIDINAGMDASGITLTTLAHELVHYVQQWSGEKYRALAEFLAEQYEKKGVSAYAAVKATQKRLIDLRGENVTFAEAYHEWMAESMSTLFNDGKLYDKLLRLKKRDSALYNYLRKFIDRIARLARKHYGTLLAETPEAQFVQGLSMDAIEALQQKFADALVEAGENYQKAEVQKDTAEVGGGQMQVRENTDIPYLQYRKLLNKKPLKDSGKYYGKVNGARIDKYRNLAEENIPDIDFFEIAEYNKVDEGYVYTVRNYNKLNFVILSRTAIKTKYDGYVMEVSTDGKTGEEIGNGNDVKGTQHQGHETSDRLPGNQGALRANAGGGFETESANQGRRVGHSDIDSGRGIKASQNSDRMKPSDAGYMEVLALGDVETVQRMVDEAAKDAGYTIKAYHGTTNQEEHSTWNAEKRMWDTTYTPITVFRRQYDEQVGHFFSADKDNAGGYGSKLYSVYLMMKNPLVIECDGQTYSSISFNGKEMDTYEWAEYARKHRYDGVIFKNVRDGVDYGALSVPTTDYVVFDSNRIKSADPVTYDKDRNVIPLSERFKVTNWDIRYQDRMKQTVSGREAFAQVLDSVATDGADRLTIQRYRDAAKAMDEQERKLNEINAQIREITHGSGKQDAAKLRELRLEASKARNRAKLYEDQLTKLEHSQPYQKMIKDVREASTRTAKRPAPAGTSEEVQRQNSIVDQIRNALPDIMELSSACTIDSSNATHYTASRKADENSGAAVFRSQGGYADRKGFGRVVLGKKGAVNTVYHGNGPAKQAAFPAIKSVIEKGVEIGRDFNHDGKGFDTVTFAAPVNFFGRKVPLGVVVKVFNNGRGDKSFYIHEICDAEGNYIKLADEMTGKKEISNTGVVDSSSTAGVADSGISPKSSLAQPDHTVKADFDEQHPGREISKAGTSEEVNAVGAAAVGFDTLSSLEYEYGNLPEGENAVRDDTLPKSTNGKDKVSLTARTVKGAKVTPDDFVELLDKDVVEGLVTHCVRVVFLGG